MTHHILKATKETVHLGGFSHLLKPALIVNSNDTIDVETYTGYYVYDKAPPEFLTPEFVDICKNLPPERKIASGPHLLTGPIYIRDAEPGDVLEIQLEAISPRLPIGFNAIRTGWGALPQQFPHPTLKFIPLDLENNFAEFPLGSNIKIPLTPFFGILGVATPENSRNSIPPGAYGGNIDNRELQAGSRLFLPIYLPGALFSIGDGHSAQGDGEVNVTAIETSMNGRIKLKLRKDLQLKIPIAETPTDFITMGFAPTLDNALELALKNMIYFLERFTNLSPEDAYILCSLAVNFHITQVVNNPQKGVHGMLSKSIFPKIIL
ncbi:acetamidase/formamidase family protein [Anabaena cylindrica FACHB-243]|uniref:Acetamidase/Formamidase n=1 Tax=Anabaena cylindrica (strain ATCC 27899 / PCC 7122) TaxID=272123 RepID=K9ZCM8_ANACC|nr:MULTISPECIES: acetamidase/formamidase family protein [Anabaena]AFZ56347.1 Acetamidase/Formamidase [Anabaena cylindrica PCC 7122]MBD2418205.1 acetamidase/formamidase family protein [Anabaena cylindrica FACHB-243]MBY5283946.1 acetamidase/formamidase family protein [Anabaena sp. CCAP 1446/1C]MBY5308032.1 acetamidase/formamidase family protein [Anabaena sp. CCAP 1446/1C]MCM2409073.1 acetamidase/formamidase family protein [Anabaena sp. CCAP 1446/1C]